jgi:ABC-type Fe3+/spermidine/putrescine transport system ATPase subunit
VVEPEILLLDEPLSNLDASLREEMRFEIRRLHETFEITTLYVTHDQGEAMVISDRVAVLEQGRVAQIGTAEELFERPRTRFVAEFIGQTNLIEGVAERADRFVRGRLQLHVVSADLTPGPVVLSIRPHQIALAPASAAAQAQGDNVLRARVVRASYLGDTVDYQVQLEDSEIVLRVASPVSQRFRPGEAVTVTVLGCSAIRG